MCTSRNWYSKLTASVIWNGVLAVLFVVIVVLRHADILSSLLCSVGYDVDDLIKKLRMSGYDADKFIGQLFVGPVVYAVNIILFIRLVLWFTNIIGHLHCTW